MVAGMTPTTVKAGFVSAVLEAGYHVELAGGGHYSPAALHAKVAEIQGKISPGIGLTLNSLYINPRQFSFQLPLWQEMRREGLEGRHSNHASGGFDVVRQEPVGGREGYLRAQYRVRLL